MNMSGIIVPDFFNMERNKQRLTRMRVQAHQGTFDLNDARRMADTDREDNVLCRERQKEAMLHWFGDTRRGEVEAIEQRINDIDRSRRAGLPLIEPLPSIEDSFLAWTNEDEYLFEGSIKESWRDFDDDHTGLVLASTYGLDAEDDAIAISLLEEVLVNESPYSANFWTE